MSEKLIPDIDKKKKPTKKQLDIVQKLRSCRNITDYLNLETKGTTTRNYGGYIRNFFVFLEITNPIEYFKDPRLIESNSERVNYTDEIERDIRIFNKKLQDMSGSNRLAQLSAIRELLDYNKIELGNHFWKSVRKVGNKVYTETDVKALTPQQLRNVLSHANTFEKAVFLTQLSSYSRIKQVIEIEFEQLNLESDPPQIRFYCDDEKNGKPITKFISTEAKEHIKEYLPHREKYLILTLKYSRNLINGKSKLKKLEEKYKSRLFPISLSAIETRWNKLCRKENLYILDPKTKHPIYGTHSLRRYFDDNIGNRKLAEYLSNKLPKSVSAYQFKTENKLDEEFKKYEKRIWVFKEDDETLKRITETENELKETKGKLEILSEKLKINEEKYRSSIERVKSIEKALRIDLNPNTPGVQNYMSFSRALLPVFWEKLYKRNPTKEEYEQFDKELPETFEKLSKMKLKDITEIVNIDNINDIVEKVKAKKL